MSGNPPVLDEPKVQHQSPTATKLSDVSPKIENTTPKIIKEIDENIEKENKGEITVAEPYVCIKNTKIKSTSLQMQYRIPQHNVLVMIQNDKMSNEF